MMTVVVSHGTILLDNPRHFFINNPICAKPLFLPTVLSDPRDTEDASGLSCSAALTHLELYPGREDVATIRR
ncbi:hypothetical protein GDO81_022230 [Engystomops pustulosus]|uniref:Uncharacterized protein n=1 Tax=Engystomops pustulosus TaxID=76066 RepID=A0AAV6ZE90_ENGPU|nr:hypothetical protein GDO81_022230 [Engystomops pustulosus]